jgi:hypothetical protein
MPERDYSPGHHALLVVAEANMETRENLLHDAERIEKEGKNGYYDDPVGCALLLQIAVYFRKRAGPPVTLWERAGAAGLAPNLVGWLRGAIENPEKGDPSQVAWGAKAVMRRLEEFEAPPALIREVREALDIWLRGS